jgi:uncharacterized membrane protein YccC
MPGPAGRERSLVLFFKKDLLPAVPAFAYATRTLLAVALALYTAYALQLDSPASAATTVLIVANVSRGALISKSVWRLFGSLLGVVAAVVLIAAFAQTPVLFVLGLAIWVGLCTFVSSAFRYNRSYASVLAGYTVALVAIPAIAAPERIFDLALARLSVVCIGVASAGLVFVVTDPGSGPTEFKTPLLRLIAGTCRVVACAFDEDGLAAPRAARSSLATDIAALDQVVEFTDALEAGFSRYAEDVRLAAAALGSWVRRAASTQTISRSVPPAGHWLTIQNRPAMVTASIARMPLRRPVRHSTKPRKRRRVLRGRLASRLHRVAIASANWPNSKCA